MGADAVALMDAIGVKRAIFCGYDWGGRGACVAAALWPDRCAGLVSVNGYNIIDISRANIPAKPEREAAIWYQFYFHSERGRAGADNLPEGDRQAVVEAMVAEMGFRRCYLRADRGGV